GKTLTVANGGTLDIKEGAILGVHETSQVINEEGATIIGNNKIVIKSNGSDVSAPTLQHVTSTSIIINPATLLSETGQEVEYAISTTNELSTEADWQTGTTFEELTPNTQYYIFARSKENATHKAGTAQVLQVKTEVDPETPEEISINPSEIQGAWVDANGVVHANQNGTITIILHEKLHDGKTVEAKLEDYDLSSSVDTDIIKDNTVTFPHASPHIITASLKSNSALTTQVLVEVEPVSTPVNPATPTTPDNPASGSNPSANNTSTIGAVAQTGVPASLLVVVMLMLLVVGAGFMRARRKMM
ncbi:MAG: hypothetical protein LBI63_01245, partial [Candidatus Ancillula sp.]|nr:hypothetical protein [Candidatus Ancillula sp.]